MAGFGFLRQMSETFKYNRDLLAKEKRKSFDNGIYKSKGNQTGLNEKQLTALEREKLIQALPKDYSVREEQHSINVAYAFYNVHTILKTAFVYFIYQFAIIILIIFAAIKPKK